MTIRQGDIYWIELGESKGSEPGSRHPHVVVQNDLFNKSRINTVVVYALTSNLKRASVPGNVSLKKGEANLTRESVVNVSQIVTVDKTNLVEKIGALTAGRVKQIVSGLKLLIEPRDV